MTVKEVIIEYLMEHEYDGLCSDSCCCPIFEIGRYPCKDITTCRPARKRICECGDAYLTDTAEMRCNICRLTDNP
jgi:hypothetical protein